MIARETGTFPVPVETPQAGADMANSTSPAFGIGKLGRRVLSLVLLFHLAGLLVAPATVFPSADMFRHMYPAFGWWLQFLNMNQGNHFFAPNPGESTLLEYSVETAEGQTVNGRLPHRGITPRLLYHRYFMLTESLGANDDSESRVRRLLARAFARQLLRENRGKSVKLTQLIHEPIEIEERLAGIPLDDPSTFPDPLFIGRYEWTDFWDQSAN